MIKRLLSVRRIGLKLLILSFLIYPGIISSEEKEERLELPDVVIYGKYLGKMQFSPKSDFYAYLSQGNLFPLSRTVSPELRFPPHRKMPGETRPIFNYWVLLDAGAGNWWSDRVFLDCGIKNSSGLLSFRFTDFRRKGWEEDHSVNNDFFKIKGVLNQQDYYISGDIFYNYNKIIKGVESPSDTVTTHGGGVGLLSRFEFDPFTISLSGNYFLNHFLDRYFSTITTGFPETLKENIYRISVNYFSPFEYFDIYGTVSMEESGMDVFDERNTKTITSTDVILKKNLKQVVISPGIRIFVENGKVNLSPLVFLKAMIPDLQLYPFISYSERHRTNTYRDIYKRYPFVVLEIDDYTILKEKDLTGGFEGRWQKLSYMVSYSHIEYDNYLMLLAPLIESFSFRSTKKDVVKTDICFDINDFSFNLQGCYTPREKIRYEPVFEFKAAVGYKRFSPIILFAGLNSSFGIQKRLEEIDIFLINAGVESQILKNIALRFDVENIFDQRYEIWEGYTEGGVQFYASFRFKATK